MTKYAPVGCCIYCGDIDNLTDEHIIPSGLGGDWVLPKASCCECAKITGKFEDKVLRGSLWLPRLALGIRKRRRRKQPAPTSFPLSVIRNGITDKQELPISKNLPSIILPMFDQPGFLNNSAPVPGVRTTGFYIGHTHRMPQQVIQDLGADAIALEGSYDVVAFAKMIAKIAYGYAVAKLGLAHVLYPLVVPAIRGLTEDIGQWVGTIQTVHPAHSTNALHIADLHHQGSFIMVSVSLFTIQPAPIYLVLISKGSPNTNCE